jgi:hypothetical protein
MALVLKDRVKQTATAPGTGTITLLTTPTGFQAFSAVGDGNTTYFAIVDPTSGAWEVNYGTYTSSGTTLSRNATPLSSSNAGALVNFTGAVDVFLTYPSSRSVYLDAAGSAVTTLDIGTLGTSTANITTANITSGTISTAPTSNTDIVNKQYADAIASGIHFHEAVELATTAALPANTYNNGTSGVGATLTANANGVLSVDSTVTVVNNRVLVKNEVTQANNGVYVVTQVGTVSTPYILTRAADFDTAGSGVDQIDEGDFFLVTGGTANANTAWVQQTPPPIVVGTTAIVFQQFAAPITYTAGTGLNESPAFTFNIANTTVTAATYGSASAVPVFAVNAQGQLTSVTDTAIAINGSAVTGNISGSAGSVANALTLGTYLTGTSFNGSAAVTATVDATSANTASKVVARDASGNFSAGTITATLSGSSTSATTATNLAGGAANQIPYQTAAGTTSFTTAASGTNYVLNYTGSAFSWVAGTISGVPLGSNLNALTLGTYLTGTSYNGSATVTAAVDATDANTASKVVARDASGNFSANVITAALTGNASTSTNLGGGGAYTVVYQSAAGTTAYLTNGTTGQVLTANTGAAPTWGTSGSNAYTRTTYTATAGQTSFSVTYTAGYIQVYLNGVFLDSTDYTATSGTTVVLTSAAALNDIVEFIAFNTTAISNTTANNLLAGTAGQVVYQSAPNTTAFTAVGTSGQYLQSAGTGAPTWATIAAGISLSANNTWTGTQTFSGTSSVLAAVLNDAAEVVTVSATAATGTIAYDITTQSVIYYTSNASANWTVNFRASSGTSLNTLMSTGQSMTVAFLVTQGGTAYYNSAVQVDGSAVTPKWQGGTAPTAGNTSSIDSYVYTIIKTGSAAFTVFASQTKFA